MPNITEHTGPCNSVGPNHSENSGRERLVKIWARRLAREIANARLGGEPIPRRRLLTAAKLHRRRPSVQIAGVDLLAGYLEELGVPII